MARTIRIVLSLVLFAGGLAVATGTFPANVDEAEAVGYGCTASGGATLYEFEYQGVKYCTEEFKSGGTWTRPSWVTSVQLAVAGGGGGGCTGSGSIAGPGGGGGGVAYGAATVTGVATFAVTVGAGGAACSSGGASSFIGGSINWEGRGGSAGGSSGAGVKNGVTQTSSYAAGASAIWNGAPQVYAGGGGGGTQGQGYDANVATRNPTGLTITASNGTDVNNLSASIVRWVALPRGGPGYSTTALLPAAAQRDLGCGGSGGISFAYSGGYLLGSEGLSFSNTCWSAGRGAYDELDWRLGTGNPSQHYHVAGYITGTFQGSAAYITQQASSAIANSGGGGGGAWGRSGTQDGGSGGSGVVLIHYAAPVPVNNTAPSIDPASTPWVGETLTATPGTWTDPLGGTLTYSGKWIRIDSVSLAETDIPGATNSTYVVTAADIDYRLMYRETADNGTASASRNSNSTAVVRGAPTFITNSPPVTLPTGTPFTYTFVASGGSVSFSSTGSLPTGLTLSSAGVFSGTPTAADSYTFTVRATNAAGTADSPHTIHVGRASTPNPSTATERSDIPFTVTPTITLTQGATVGAAVPITVSVTSSPGNHSLAGTTTRTTDVAGVATFDDLELTGIAGSYTLSFDAGPEWPVATVSVTLTAGDPVDLAMATQPVGGVQVDTNLSTPPAVKIVDSAGNTITIDNTTVVTATLASGFAGASLVTASATASSGVATFTNLRVTGGIGPFTLAFASAPSYTTVTSSAFTILGLSQTVNFAALTAKTFGDAPFVVTASATSNLPIAFVSTTPSVCSTVAVSTTAAIVSLVGGGSCTIDASQSGDQVYSAAQSVSRQFAVNTISQVPLSMVNATVEFGRSLTLTSAGGSGTGAVSYALPSGAGSASCSISGVQLTHSAVGTCSVRAEKAADSSYQSTQSATVTVTVVKARQSVEFTSTPPVSATVGAAAYVATATASSGLAVSMSIATVSAAVCTSANSTSPMTVTFIGEGNCTLRATVSASANYEEGDEPAVQTIVVGPAGGGGLQNQWISFAPLSNMSIGDANIVLSATTSAELPVSFSTTTTSACTVTGRVLAVVGVGRCVVTATQAGDTTFAPASPVVRAFTVSPTTPHAPGLRGVSGQAGAIRVSFTPPAFDGGSPILSYRVIATPTSGTPIVSDACTSSPCTIAGLATGTSYTVTMRARNAVGWGAESASSVAVSPAANPVAVQNVSVVAGNGTLAVSWDDPVQFGGGSCTRYELRIRVAGGTWPVSAGATATCPLGSFQSMSVQNVFTQSTGTHTFSGLTPGTAYDVQIVTITSLLTTAIDTNTAVVSGIPVGPPNAPRQLSVIDSGAGQITLYWAAPLIDGGSSIIGYEVLVGSTSCGSVTIDPTSSAGTCVASGLTSQATYVITVRARNVFGLGASHTGSHTVAAHNAGTGTGGGTGGGGGGTTPNDDDDDDDSDENDGDNGDGVPRPGGPDAPPLPGNDDDDDGFPDPWRPNGDPNNRPGVPCSGCVQVFPAPSGDGGPQPGVTSSPPGSRPGIIQVSTGTGPVVTIGGANSDGRPATATSPTGGLIVGPGGNVPIVLTGLKPGSTVTVWLADQLSVSGVVGPDGTISLIASVPNGLPSGTYTGRVDMVDPSGQAQSILFGFDWVGRNGMLPVTGDSGTESLVIVLWMFVAGALIVAMSRRRHLL